MRNGCTASCADLGARTRRAGGASRSQQCERTRDFIPDGVRPAEGRHGLVRGDLYDRPSDRSGPGRGVPQRQLQIVPSAPAALRLRRPRRRLRTLSRAGGRDPSLPGPVRAREGSGARPHRLRSEPRPTESWLRRVPRKNGVRGGRTRRIGAGRENRAVLGEAVVVRGWRASCAQSLPLPFRPVRGDFNLLVVGPGGPRRHRHREHREGRVPVRSKLERRADENREADAGLERNHLCEDRVVPPHLPAAFEDVPDLIDRAITACPGDRAWCELEAIRAPGRNGEQLAYV